VRRGRSRGHLLEEEDEKMEMRHYIRAAGLMRTILATLLTDTLVSCSTIPEPIKDNIKYPHTFHDVGYLEKYGRIAFDDVEDLTVDLAKLVYSDKDGILEIKFEVVEDIAYEKIFFTGPNKYVVISYKDGLSSKKAMFTAFKYNGWFGGTSEIDQVILHAYGQYK
jgi:hypothetical protein